MQGWQPKLGLVVLALLGFSACGRQGDDGSTTKQFFENAVRRNPTAAEQKVVANLDGCTSYFVENTKGLTYVGTARHCVNAAINDWCSRGGRIRRPNGTYLSCKRVIAASMDLDIALFEAQGASVPTSETLRLAAYSPAVGTRLKMIGYPADQYRLGALTVTENCWVLVQESPSPYTNYLDRSSRHNCTTYGGNSGGPMLREGSRDVVGQPFTYVRGDYHERSADNINTSASLAQMAGFVERHRANLLQNGIVISETPQ